MEKCTNYFSIVNIYDTYGLEITRLFLHHLLANKRQKEANWLACYLLGSLIVLNREAQDMDRSEYDVENLSSILWSELVALDSQQPVASEPLLLAPPLPIELIAKIVNSARISKSLSSIVLSIRAETEPNEEELVDSTYPSTMCVRGRYLCTWIEQGSHMRDHSWSIVTPLSEHECNQIEEWSLAVDHGVYRLQHLIGDEVKDDECDGYTIVHSLNLYECIYNNRGCNGPSVVISMLQKMSRQFECVTEDNVSQVCVG
jgi:hypothetical protein